MGVWWFTLLVGCPGTAAAMSLVTGWPSVYFQHLSRILFSIHSFKFWKHFYPFFTPLTPTTSGELSSGCRSDWDCTVWPLSETTLNKSAVFLIFSHFWIDWDLYKDILKTQMWMYVVFRFINNLAFKVNLVSVSRVHHHCHHHLH